MTTKASEVEIHEAFDDLITWFHANPKSNALDYAVAYAKAGVDMTGEELRVQVLYVLSNITHWRGDVARVTRATLKSF